MRVIEMNPEEILKELNITDEVLAIYPYGSQVYGYADANSDRDYVIVYKAGLLPDGSFRSNAISNKDRTMQAVLYSRGGFIDAINNYEIRALECLSTKPILLKWPFKIQKWDEKQFVKKIIEKASNSRHIADQSAQYGNTLHAAKGMFHALRILMFGLQLKEHQKILDFSVANELYSEMMASKKFDTRDYYIQFDKLSEELRK